MDGHHIIQAKMFCENYVDKRWDQNGRTKMAEKQSDKTVGEKQSDKNSRTNTVGKKRLDKNGRTKTDGQK